MRFIKIIFIVLIILLFAIIYTQNLDVFTHQFELKLDLKTYIIGPYITQNIVIILASFVVGAVIAIFFGALQSITASSDSRYKGRRIKELEAKVRELSAEGPRTESASASPSSPSSSPFSPPDESGSTHQD